MKKIILIALLVITAGTLNAQVKSVTLDSTKAIVGGGNLYYSIVTTQALDTFYTKVEVSSDQIFNTPFQTPYWVRHIGSGSFMETIGKPLVDTLVLSYVRVIATDDTTKGGTKSNNLSLTPKHKVEKPLIYSVSRNTTNSGMTEKVGYNTGYDNSEIKCEVALDASYLYKTNTQTWIIKSGVVGFQSYSVSGLKDNKKFWIRWTITNSNGSHQIKDTFWTISNAKKIWLHKPADTVNTTSSTCDIKGRAISYGLTGNIWATIGGVTVSNIFSLTGIGEEWYQLYITGLVQNTNYIVWVHGNNDKGEDSFAISFVTPKYFNPVFSVNTIMASASSNGLGEAWASYNVPQGQTANITVGLFAGSDSLCTTTLFDSTFNLSEGSGQLYKSFPNLAPGMYWVWFWGTCSDGQYELAPKPLAMNLWSMGVGQIERLKISIYPNPATDFIHTSSYGLYSIHTVTGQIVATGNGSDINVSNLKTGTYLIKTETGFAKFKKL